MKSVYYKVVRENMTFDEAIEAFKKGEIIRYKYKQPLCPSEIKNIDGIGFTIEQIHSNDWVTLAVDDDMENLRWEVSDMFHDMGIEIDSSFFHEENMDISSYWGILTEKTFLDDKLMYEIIKWVYDNKKYKTKQN